jgi:hypothetical protein
VRATVFDRGEKGRCSCGKQLCSSELLVGVAFIAKPAAYAKSAKRGRES